MTPFAKKVYRVVLKIPLGQVRSYKWVAAKAGHPKAARAVGQILKNNPYPVLIPCHRVVKSGKGIGGYLFGAKKKKALLELERAIARQVNTTLKPEKWYNKCLNNGGT
jgi:methylated-DNA-[protein]-cysteine S-methyltransferase